MEYRNTHFQTSNTYSNPSPPQKLTLNLLSCNTFLIATSSPVSQSVAWKTTPKLPLPITLVSVYDTSCGLSGPWPAVATTVVTFEPSLPVGGKEKAGALFNKGFTIYSIKDVGWCRYRRQLSIGNTSENGVEIQLEAENIHGDKLFFSNIWVAMIS